MTRQSRNPSPPSHRSLLLKSPPLSPRWFYGKLQRYEGDFPPAACVCHSQEGKAALPSLQTSFDQNRRCTHQAACRGYQHQHVHIWGQLLYITIGTSKKSLKNYGHFVSPRTDSISENHPPTLYNDSSSGQTPTPHLSRVMYNHIRKLNLAYSPSNKIFRSLVYKSFVEELRMQLYEFDGLFTDGRKVFDLNRRQIVIMYNVLENKKIDLSCLISFPTACDKTKCIPYTISGDNDDCLKKALESSTEALGILSGRNDQIEMYEDIVHLTYPNVPLLGGFIFLLHMFLAQESNSPDQFADSIKQLHREKDILEKVKLWTTQYLYNVDVNPMWLNNILPKADRKHGIWEDDHDNNRTGLSWHKK